jgi:hypothetical protein
VLVSLDGGVDWVQGGLSEKFLITGGVQLGSGLATAGEIENVKKKSRCFNRAAQTTQHGRTSAESFPFGLEELDPMRKERPQARWLKLKLKPTYDFDITQSTN